VTTGRTSHESTYRLLLVEDNRDASIAGAHLLNDAGFAVDLARTGADGLEKAKVADPDVIVTDLMLPDINGEDLVRELRRRRATRRIPVLVYTAVTDADRLARLVRLEVRVFAIKPCVPTVIGVEARRLLRGQTPHAICVLTGYGEILEDLVQRLSDLAYVQAVR
jgi:DNA-binding response OmpR family regulator